MQNQAVSGRQLRSVCNNLVGVPYLRILGRTPRRMLIALSLSLDISSANVPLFATTIANKEKRSRKNNRELDGERPYLVGVCSEIPALIRTKTEGFEGIRAL